MPKNKLNDLADQVDKTTPRLPPVGRWNPPLLGELDMRIARDGQWFYLGSAIQRPALVKLFSTILKREGEQYFLVTPVEKWRIEVEDAPFVVVTMEIENQEGRQTIFFTTQTEDRFCLDQDHPLWVISNSIDPEQPRPYATVRRNLPALICRAVYYQLVDCAIEQTDSKTGCTDYVVTSAGQTFSLLPG